jgi:GNAT superfamily N-acetyltransferase
MKIKKATLKDLKDILRLNKDLFTYETQFDKTYNQDWTYSDIGKDYFENRIEDKENALVLVARDDEGKILGYLCAHASRFPYRAINPIAEVENMLVVEEHRRKGVGTKLVKEFNKWCQEKGIKRLKVGMLSKNTPAVSFYKKSGFEEFNLVLEKDID